MLSGQQRGLARDVRAYIACNISSSSSAGLAFGFELELVLPFRWDV